MKTNLFHTLTVFVFCLLVACKSEAQKQVLAEKDGYKLTQKHIDGMLAFAQEGENKLSEEEKEAYTQVYIAEFLANPKETIKELEAYLSNTEPEPKPTPEPKEVKNEELASGHLKVRQVLGSDIGKMQFDTKAANNFRTYITNSLLETTSYNSDSGYDNYHRRSGSGKIQLCADGTYVEALYSEVVIDVGGTSGTSSGTTYIPGYWEVAALPKGLYVILFYSQHPSVLEDFPNGFQPWFVPKYGENFVSLPSGELYKRTANISCN